MLRSPAPFERLRAEVEALMRFNAPFDEVERAIDGAATTEDQRAALWLVAWGLNDRRSS